MFNGFKADAQETFPPWFPDIGGKTFLWVKNIKSVFCDFVLKDMTQTSGLFAAFQTYLQNTK